MDTGDFSEQEVRAGLAPMLADALLCGYTCGGRMSFPLSSRSGDDAVQKRLLRPRPGKVSGEPKR